MSFDLITKIIISVGVINTIVFFATHISVNHLRNLINPKGDRRNGVQVRLKITDEESNKLCKTSFWASGLYTFYSNITAIFPLLGILGTVWALMQLNSTGAENISINFSVALNTTFAGLICAIIFKSVDFTVSPRLDHALDDADYLIKQHDEEKRKEYATPAETGYHH